MNWRRASQRRTITNYITHDIKKNCLNFGWGVGLVAWLGGFRCMEMNKKSASPKKTLPPVGAIAAIVAIVAIVAIEAIEAIDAIEGIVEWGAILPYLRGGVVGRAQNIAPPT